MVCMDFIAALVASLVAFIVMTFMVRLEGFLAASFMAFFAFGGAAAFAAFIGFMVFIDHDPAAASREPLVPPLQPAPQQAKSADVETMMEHDLAPQAKCSRPHWA